MTAKVEAVGETHLRATLEGQSIQQRLGTTGHQLVLEPADELLDTSNRAGRGSVDTGIEPRAKARLDRPRDIVAKWRGQHEINEHVVLPLLRATARTFDARRQPCVFGGQRLGISALRCN